MTGTPRSPTPGMGAIVLLCLVLSGMAGSEQLRYAVRDKRLQQCSLPTVAPSSKVQETGCPPPPAPCFGHQLVYSRHMLQTAPTLGQKTKYENKKGQCCTFF